MDKKEPTKRTNDGQRDAKGRFVAGNNANPRGRAKLPPEFQNYAKQAPARLREICDDPDTPVKIRADIERWFAEMWYGKAPQAVDLEGEVKNTGTTTVRFEGVLDEWSK